MHRETCIERDREEEEEGMKIETKNMTKEK
jgi:hypothetical protein